MNTSRDEKAMSLISQLKEGPTGDRNILHDLHGPLINISGLSTEIHNTLEKMRELLCSKQSDMEPQLFEELTDLIVNDLSPCISHIDASKQQLTERLNTFSSKA